MNYRPNEEAALWFAREVWPIDLPAILENGDVHFLPAGIIDDHPPPALRRDRFVR